MASRKKVSASPIKNTPTEPATGRKLSARLQAAKTDALTSRAQKPAKKISAKTQVGNKSAIAIVAKSTQNKGVVPAKKPVLAAKGATVAKVGSKNNQKPPVAQGKTQSKKRARDSEPKPEPELAQTATKKQRIIKGINKIPQHKLDIYVFGSGDSGELGLGHLTRSGQKPIEVTLPRLNDLLDSKTVGVISIAVGGMHCVAITDDQKIITWGVNDIGALGRDTTRQSDDGSDDDADDSGLNPKECTPIAIPSKYFDEAAGDIVQVAATDSASFALTSLGLVYGWGTFSGSDGIIGFSKNAEVQKTPVLLTSLKKITSLAAGGNHMLALDAQGRIYGWGCGQQFQLGRPIMESYRMAALTPSLVRLPRSATANKNKVTSIACGQFHSFAVTSAGKVFAWGLNNYGQTGIFPPVDDSPKKDATSNEKEDSAPDPATLIITKPSEVLSFGTRRVSKISGGNHHSIAIDDNLTVLIWGRCDSSQAGLPLSAVPADYLIRDRRNNPRILAAITAVPDIPRMDFVAAGIDNNLAIDVDGRAWSWGFGDSYRTGLGNEELVETPTLLADAVVKGKKLVWAGCGGQFSVLAGLAAEGDEMGGVEGGGDVNMAV